MGVRFSRRRARGLAALAALLWLLAGAPACRDAGAPEGRPAAALSLWALGDTGEPPAPWPQRNPQEAVAEALERRDRAAPAHGVVLLGDNFYPDGLREREFKDRLRANIVSPYCRFLRLTPRGRGSLADSCQRRSSPREDVQILAVLGNHDYGERESPMLQSRRIPEYIANWRMPRGEVLLVELPGSVSLVLLQSQPIVERRATTDALSKQLAKARGRWRIVAAHHPVLDPGRGYDEPYAHAVRAAFEAAGEPVHLFLAGHEHNLQVLEGEAPLPALQVVSGAGSDVREVSETRARRRFALASFGFARVDVWDGDDPRLEVTLYAVRPPRLGGLLGRGAARVVSRWVLGPDGQVAPLPLGPTPGVARTGLRSAAP
jgi:hypothetical protein